MLQNIVNSLRNISHGGSSGQPQDSDSAASTRGADDFSPTNADLAKQVLGEYKKHSKAVREDVLKHLTGRTLSFLAGAEDRKRREAAREGLMNRSMMAIVDRVYGIIEPYIPELNDCLPLSELRVAATSPALVTEHLIYDGLRRPVKTVTTYRARLSTSRLSVVIRGFEDRVDFFMLPVQQIMGLSKIESEHAPLMTFSGFVSDGRIDWEVEGKPLSEDRLERYCLLLFNYLIDETRDELESFPLAAGS